MANKNTVLVVAAHSDDEALGCAGTIAKHVDSGDDVFVVFMTDGVGARGSSDGSDERHTASDKALSLLGVKKAYRFDFPDNQMDSVPLLSVTKQIEAVVLEVSPSIVYTHFSGDLNVDHQITHKAVMTACRPQAWCSVKEIYCFEVLSATEWNSKSAPQFLPQRIVDITNQIDRKIDALKCYEQEMRPSPHSRCYRSVLALAEHRGLTHGLPYAEAFFIERCVA